MMELVWNSLVVGFSLEIRLVLLPMNILVDGNVKSRDRDPEFFAPTAAQT